VADPRWAEAPRRGAEAAVQDSTAQMLLHQQLDEKRLKYNKFIEFLQHFPQLGLWQRLAPQFRARLLELGEKALAANALRLVQNQR